MALNQSYEFEYHFDPLIFVRLFAIDTGQSALTRAIIDTGASRTIFDAKLAAELGMDLSEAPIRYLQGIEGTSIPVQILEVELWLLDEPELSLVFPIGFLPNVGDTVGNLFGLDVLSQFDLGLQHGLLKGTLGVTQQ